MTRVLWLPTDTQLFSIKAIYTQVLFLLLRRRALEEQAKIMMTDGQRHSEQESRPIQINNIHHQHGNNYSIQSDR